jgi:hypothetical protein
MMYAGLSGTFAALPPYSHKTKWLQGQGLGQYERMVMVHHHPLLDPKNLEIMNLP